MKKLCVFLTALLLPIFAFGINANAEKAIVKVPLNFDSGNIRPRNMVPELISCNYSSLTNAIVTTFYSCIGDVNFTVANLMTGEIWYDTYDSSQEPQAVLYISGSRGTYVISYIAESGHTYEGILVIE